VIRAAVDDEADDVYDESDLHLEGRFQLPDGRLVTWDQLVAESPSVMESGPDYPSVDLLIPVTRYRAIEIREAAVHAALIGRSSSPPASWWRGAGPAEEVPGG
jgi:hypothetical protein